jgi:hypothetical protein
MPKLVYRVAFALWLFDGECFTRKIGRLSGVIKSVLVLKVGVWVYLGGQFGILRCILHRHSLKSGCDGKLARRVDELLL